jgi:Lon protease-like protein
MSKPFDVREQLAAFTGCAPIFPLPNVVHFPHLLLPLHIFEPRYRQMVGDALAGSRLIAMALLKPGWLTTEGSPPIHDTVCLGRITAEQDAPDGRYYLVLQGLSRARIVREDETNRAYRVAEMTLHPDADRPTSETAAAAQRRRLIGAFRKLFPRRDLDKVLRRALDEAVPLGILCDVLTDAMSLDPQDAHRVLAELDINRRCGLVLRLIHQKLRGDAKAVRAAWPPEFSVN